MNLARSGRPAWSGLYTPPMRSGSSTLAALGSVILFLAAGAAAQDGGRTWEFRRPPSAEAVPVTVEPEAIEFGSVMPESEQKTTLKVTSTGGDTLKIAGVRSTCWCTIAEPEKREIGPGETITIDVSLEAPDMLGELGRRVFIMFEGFSQPVSVDVRASVSRGIEAKVLYDDQAQRTRGTLILEAADGTPFRVLSTNFDALGSITETSDTAHELDFDLSGRGAGRSDRWLLVETDHPTAPIVDVLTAPERPSRRSRPPVMFAGDRIYLGTVEPGATIEESIVMTGAWDDADRAVKRMRASGAFDVELLGSERVKQGVRLDLRISVPEARSGLAFGRVDVSTSDGRRGDFALFGRVIEASPAE